MKIMVSQQTMKKWVKDVTYTVSYSENLISIDVTL